MSGTNRPSSEDRLRRRSAGDRTRPHKGALPLRDSTGIEPEFAATSSPRYHPRPPEHTHGPHDMKELVCPTGVRREVSWPSPHHQATPSLLLVGGPHRTTQGWRVVG